ncbi:MAG: Gfo/Idh/MocA family oxidoreductase [Ilumatobacteraceae bacterium]
MEPVRVVVAGCGLVAEFSHLPALAKLADDVEVVGLVDPSPVRREICARRAPLAATFADLGDALAALSPDEVVVASPAEFHLENTLASLGAGAHVICEKPMALTSAACTEMIGAAEAADRLLGVGLMRRFFPSVQAIASIVSNGVLGAPVSFAVLEGVPFGWPGKSAHPFRRGAGGGVLFDSGPHLVDVLLFWFDDLELADYADDAMGGVEANCRFRLTGAGGVTGTVRLSRDTFLSNRHLIQCERGWVIYQYDVSDRFYWGWNGSPTANCVMLSEPGWDRPMWASPDPQLQVPRALSAAFVAQHRNMTDAIRGTASLLVSAREAAAGIALLESCHASRRLMDMPWMDPDEIARATELERKIPA